MRVRSALVSRAGYGASAVLLPDGWLLAHGSLLRDDELRDLLGDGPGLLAPGRRVEFRLQYQPDHQATRAPAGNSEGSCSLRALWRSHLVRRSLDDVAWRFEPPGDLLSVFLLLREEPGDAGDAGDAGGPEEGAQALRRLLEGLVHPPGRGAALELESAPFASGLLLGSLSQGLLSNVLGEAGCLLLTDASAAPGCEGAPLFLLQEPHAERQLCGLIIAPLSWCRGERVDYALAADLRVCLEELLGQAPPPAKIPRAAPVNRDLAASLDRSTVLVECAGGWGTGVVVDAPTRTVLTCSHVVRVPLGSRVKVGLNDGVKGWARLVYRSPEEQPYDIAVLKLEQCEKDLESLTFATEEPAKGSAVLTAGFPFFARTPASLSRGVVARQTSCVLQTTCCIESGASGGPILGCADGRLLGIVVSNAGSAGASRALYPRINMAVPANVLRQPILDYVASEDIQYLKGLSTSDPVVQDTWNYCLTPRSKM